MKEFIIIYLVTWSALILRPQEVQYDEFGRAIGYITDELNYTWNLGKEKEFTDRDKAFDFMSRAKLQDGIRDVEIDSCTAELWISGTDTMLIYNFDCWWQQEYEFNYEWLNHSFD